MIMVKETKLSGISDEFLIELNKLSEKRQDETSPDFVAWKYQATSPARDDNGNWYDRENGVYFNQTVLSKKQISPNMASNKKTGSRKKKRILKRS